MKVDIKKTKHYYDNYDDVCDCNACKYYTENVAEKFPNLKDFLESIGADINKPFDTSWINDDNHIIYLSVQYVIFGNWGEEDKINFDEFVITKSDNHPNTNIKGDHFVLHIERFVFEFNDGKEPNKWIN